MSSSWREIYNILDQEKAFGLIEKMDVSDRQKATYRYQWKKKHIPSQIKHPKQQDVKKISTDQDRIHQLEQRITDLEIQLRDALERIDRSSEKPPSSNSISSQCFICKKDPEGYDLPCGHEICHPCFRKNLDENGDIACKVCQHRFQFHEELMDEEEDTV